MRTYHDKYITIEVEVVTTKIYKTNEKNTCV